MRAHIYTIQKWKVFCDAGCMLYQSGSVLRESGRVLYKNGVLYKNESGLPDSGKCGSSLIFAILFSFPALPWNKAI